MAQPKTINNTLHIQYNTNNHSSEQLLELYQAILLPRAIENKMLNLLRQGKVSKWFSGIGQEAIAVGVTKALFDDEYICPLHRNLGVFTSRNMPFRQLFLQWQGKLEGYSKGRERSFHFGTNPHHIVGMISHLGPQLCVASGIALGSLLKNEKKVAIAFTGDGGTSEGDFHEALNVASVWKLPVIFIIENNGYGLSTTVQEQYNCKSLVDRAVGYGMQGIKIDGNNIIEVYETIKKVATEIRQNPQPVLIECMTFRMRGHEEASGTKYVPKELLDTWTLKDPVLNFETYLLNKGILTPQQQKKIHQEIDTYISQSLEGAFDIADIIPNITSEINDVYAPYTPTLAAPNYTQQTEKRFIDAISEGLEQSMEQHPNLVLMGQDIAEYGGVFKVTQGFVEKFGKQRVRNTPLCESAILGISMGLSIKSFKSMVEMQFADFVTCGFNQIINSLAKSHYRWGQNADVVIRMPTGAGVGAGPFHSQSNEAWFTHTPGLKVLYPSNPFDAKGLLIEAFNDPNPILFFEHKALYRAISGNVPAQPYTLPIGKAKVVQEGNQVSIITYGMGVHWATKTLQLHPNISADIIDLRTLLPIDTETIYSSIKKTGKAIILHEDCLTGGIGGEISALIAQHCFNFLDAPIMRCAALDTPVPFALPLEQQFLPDKRFTKMLIELIDY